MMINQQVQDQLDKVVEVATYLWERGWVERNGGNISVNLTGLQDADSLTVDPDRFVHHNCPTEAANMVFFFTATGERLRDLRKDIRRVACIIKVNGAATGYTVVWGGEDNPDLRPTSEFISHLKIHLECSSDGNAAKRCIVHAHPNELIALSHHPRFPEVPESFCKTLWSMLPEVRLFVPRGISLLPYALPGGDELATLTVSGFQDSDVVLWEKHGALAFAEDAIEAFDLLDVSNKGAAIYLKCLGAGFTPSGLSDRQLKELEETYLNDQ